ncbi:response regulator [Thiolapillus sp.]
MKVLLVDDSKAARFAMGKLLKDQGLEVETAASGEEALDKIATEDIDIVFMDQSMPGMGGIAATTAITSNEKTSHIPVVLCTGNEGDKLEEMAREAGAIGVLTKPPQAEKLQAMLASINVETIPEVEEETEKEPAAVETAPAIDMDAIMAQVDTLLQAVREEVTTVEQKLAQELSQLASTSEARLQPLHDSLKKMDERIAAQVKEQMSMDAGNHRIQLEALRQQVETGLDDIKEQETRLREDLVEDVNAKMDDLLNERLAELKDGVKDTENSVIASIKEMEKKVSSLQGSLLMKSALISIISAAAAFGAAYFLLK